MWTWRGGGVGGGVGKAGGGFEGFQFLETEENNAWKEGVEYEEEAEVKMGDGIILNSFLRPLVGHRLWNDISLYLVCHHIIH